jgi:NDP-mannose synthase
VKAVILAGGKGTRLAPYTKILPKPLMPIGDVPILEIILLQLKAAGITNVVLTVGHLAELLRAFFKDGSHLGINITYNYEKTPLGTAGPLAFVDGLDEPFLVMNGDVLTTIDYLDLVRFHQEHEAALTIAMHARKVHIDLGVIEANDHADVVGYIEKPTIDYMVSMGVYVFDPGVRQYIPRGLYMDFPDLVKKLIADGEHVTGYPFEGYWQDLGRPDDYEQASQDFDAMRHKFLPEK